MIFQILIFWICVAGDDVATAMPMAAGHACAVSASNDLAIPSIFSWIGRDYFVHSRGEFAGAALGSIGCAGLPMPAATFYKNCRMYPVYVPQMPASVLTAIALNKLRGSCAAPDRGDEKLGRVAAAQV